jgi:Ser/Thr protein kinase RdoA (MazF antagonist)
VPDGEPVLVHGDLWQGNTVWNGDTCSGLIDWDAAGAGSAGHVAYWDVAAALCPVGDMAYRHRDHANSRCS